MRIIYSALVFCCESQPALKTLAGNPPGSLTPQKNPSELQWSRPPSPALTRSPLSPPDRVLPLCLTPQEDGVVVQDYSAVSVSEQLWVRPQHLHRANQLRVGPALSNHCSLSVCACLYYQFSSASACECVCVCVCLLLA